MRQAKRLASMRANITSPARDEHSIMRKVQKPQHTHLLFLLLPAFSRYCFVRQRWEFMHLNIACPLRLP